jgi:hypothetical protein
MRVYSIITVGLWLLVAGFRANASHISGGEFTYTCLGNNKYRIQLNIYQDCLTGEPPAIEQDNPALITVYDGTGAFIRFDSIQYSSYTKIPANFQNDCLNNPPPTCLSRMTFTRDYTLPPNAINSTCTSESNSAGGPCVRPEPFVPRFRQVEVTLE